MSLLVFEKQMFSPSPRLLAIDKLSSTVRIVTVANDKIEPCMSSKEEAWNNYKIKGRIRKTRAFGPRIRSSIVMELCGR